MRDGEQRGAHLLDQGLHRVALNVRKRAVDPGEKRRNHASVHAGTDRRRRSRGGCLGARLPPAPPAPASPAPSSAPPAPPSGEAPSGLLASGRRLLRVLARGAVFVPLVSVPDAPPVQRLEQREVKLHQLRGELRAFLAVVERELVEKHRGVILRFQTDAAAETKRLNLPRHDALHRGVLLRDELD